MFSISPCCRTRVSAVAFRATRYGAHSFVSKPHLSKQDNYEQPNDPTKRQDPPTVSKTNEVAVDSMGAWDRSLQESQEAGEEQRQLQAPNRAGIWSRSQQPRERAMIGPRFEQTIMEAQPQPFAAIELAHKQPVRWVEDRIVACDGGGGPLGHPKIFISTDKPEIATCNYCSLPYANVHHKKYLESLPSNPYPLQPTDDPVQVQLPTTPSLKGAIQGQYPRLKGEIEAQNIDNSGYTQR